jgi:hypothetical protein
MTITNTVPGWAVDGLVEGEAGGALSGALGEGEWGALATELAQALATTRHRATVRLRST